MEIGMEQPMTEEQPTTQGKSALTSGIIIVAIMFAISAWAWLQLPADAQIPVHWGVSGQPDRYGGKIEGLLLMPLIGLGLVALFAIIPRVEPRKSNIMRSQKAYGVVRLGVLLFLLGIHIVTVLSTLGYPIDINFMIGLGTGLLFIVMGNYLGKVRSNFMFGIRTPWTLTSDLAWNKTHRLGGWLFVLSGVLIILCAIVAPQWIVGAILLGALGTAGITTVYSYRVWKDDPNKRAGE